MAEASPAGRRPGLPVRLAVVGVIGVALAAYYAFSDELGELSLWGDTAFIALVLMPAVFALVYFAFRFLGYFESLWWLVLVAGIIPFIDSYSVWRGPTRHIVYEQRDVFTTLSFAFPVPGERGSANLGLPDLLFFALFLAAAVRWRLRIIWTWLAMVLSFGATMAIAVWWDVGGLP